MQLTVKECIADDLLQSSNQPLTRRRWLTVATQTRKKEERKEKNREKREPITCLLSSAVTPGRRWMLYIPATICCCSIPVRNFSTPLPLCLICNDWSPHTHPPTHTYTPIHPYSFTFIRINQPPTINIHYVVQTTNFCQSSINMID